MGNETTATELVLGAAIVFATLLFAAWWLGESAACGKRSCPAGQVPEMVQTSVGMSCACVLR